MICLDGELVSVTKVGESLSTGEDGELVGATKVGESMGLST
jgi:hypothetical protein